MRTAAAVPCRSPDAPGDDDEILLDAYLAGSGTGSLAQAKGVPTLASAPQIWTATTSLPGRAGGNQAITVIGSPDAADLGQQLYTRSNPPLQARTDSQHSGRLQQQCGTSSCQQEQSHCCMKGGIAGTTEGAALGRCRDSEDKNSPPREKMRKRGAAASGRIGAASEEGMGAIPHPCKRRSRLTDEERAARLQVKELAKEEARQRKMLERIAKAEAKQYEEGLKRDELFGQKKATGSYAQAEMVVLIDTRAEATELGACTVEGLLQCPAGAMSYALRDLPLGSARAAGGAYAFAFARRKLTSDDAKRKEYQEDCRLPYVQLVFDNAEEFVQRLLKDQLRELLAEAQRWHPDCTLGILVVGLPQYVQQAQRRLEAVSKATVDVSLLRLQLSCPALHVRMVKDTAAAVEHTVGLARALAEQPYKGYSHLEAQAGKEASQATADAELLLRGRGPELRHFVRGLSVLKGGHTAVAIGLAYPSIGALVSAYRQAQSHGLPPHKVTSELLLPPDNARRVGDAISMRLHELFTSDDPDQVIEAK